MSGEQDHQVPQLYVESFVLGDGGSSSDGIGSSKWWCKCLLCVIEILTSNRRKFVQATQWIFFIIHSFTVFGQSQGTDWEDFLGIVCLLIINSTISFIEENNAGDAAAALMARLALKTKVFFF